MTTLYEPLKINGVVSTDKTVLQNLNDLCTAAGAFLTYDISQGKWAVVINKTGTSIKSYDDTNIIGSINVTETGVSELYNSASLEFPHRLLRDETDFVQVTIDPGERFANEVDNVLSIQSDLINDPVQAQYIAGVELKQSRLNKIVTFSTDYTSLGMKAGDLIDVTSEMYGYTNKVFRITRIEENDEDVIGITITALEYSADVYSTAGLTATEKTKKTGILLKQQNDELKKSDDADISRAIIRMIGANVGLGILNKLLNKLFGRNQIGVDANGNPIYDNQVKPNDADLDKVLGGAKKPALTDIDSASATVCAGDNVTVTVTCNCTNCLFDLPTLDYPYEITGVMPEDLDIALTGTVAVTGGVGMLTIFVAEDAPAGTMSVTIGGLNTTIEIGAKSDYTIDITKSSSSITEGQSVTFDVASTGSLLNGFIPYTITGTASGKVTSPSLTGTITATNGVSSLVVATSSNSTYQGTLGLTVTFGSTSTMYCGTTGFNSTSVTVLDSTSPPVSCNYVSVPVVWCGSFNAATGALESITSVASAMLPVPSSGGSTVMVPYACHVSGGSVVVDEQIAVAADSYNVGGQAFRVITSFSAPSNKLIVGTTTTLYGY